MLEEIFFKERIWYKKTPVVTINLKIGKCQVSILEILILSK